jgi:hypothetical protein
MQRTNHKKEKVMATTIYFPSINAEAVINTDIKRGGTAAVCASWDGNAYIGRVRNIKFTTSRPANWDRKDEVHVLKHIPDGGFAYEINLK